MFNQLLIVVYWWFSLILNMII